MNRFNPLENVLKSGHCVLGITVGGTSFGNQMNVPMMPEQGPFLSKIFSHETLDAVSRNSFAYPLTDGNAQSAAFDGSARKKYNKVLILYLFTVFYQMNELWSLQQPVGFAKTLPFWFYY